VGTRLLRTLGSWSLQSDSGDSVDGNDFGPSGDHASFALLVIPYALLASNAMRGDKLVNTLQVAFGPEKGRAILAFSVQQRIISYGICVLQCPRQTV
jgi:hypothetical protein